MLKDLFEKKKIKTMNNKMAKNIILSTIGYKKQTKQTWRTEIESWIQRALWWLSDGIGVWGTGWRGERVKKYKEVVTE